MSGGSGAAALCRMVAAALMALALAPLEACPTSLGCQASGPPSVSMGRCPDICTREICRAEVGQGHVCTEARYEYLVLIFAGMNI